MSAHAEQTQQSDDKVAKAGDDASDGCAKNCGSCGKTIAGWKTKFDDKVKAMSYTTFRWLLRGCNVFQAGLVIMCVILGFISFGIDTYAAFVLTLMLLVGGIVLCMLEMPCCCNDMDGKLRRNVPFMYYARGRAWTLVLLAFLAFGMGAVPIVIGVFCLLPWGLLSRYMMAIYPKCGDRLVTTQSASDIAEIEATGITIYDHFMILDVHDQAQLMTSGGITKLKQDLDGVTGVSFVAAIAPAPTTEAVPAHEEPSSGPKAAPSSGSNPFMQEQPAQAEELRVTMEAPQPIAGIEQPAVTNAFGQPDVAIRKEDS